MSTLGDALQQGMPYANAPLVNGEGVIQDYWYRFLHALFVKLGGTQSLTQQQTYVVNGPGGLQVYSSATGQLLGTLVSSGTKGAPAVAQVVGPSPWTFQALVAGVLIVESGQVELSRDGTTFYICGLAGAPVPLLNGDSVRVTYYDAAPKVTFLPETAS